jgi:hypothetical protein
MTYTPKYFEVHELVNPEAHFALSGDPRKIFSLFDDRLLITADRLRERFGPMTVNNWRRGGERKESGLREPFTRTGARWSQHKFGRALDALIRDISAEEVRKQILADPFHPDFEYITCLEMTVDGKPISWLHFSVQNWSKGKNGILQLHL